MITIIMPAYNEEQNIAEAINSILNQEFRDFELLIVDDGSIDGTEQIVSKIVAKNSEKIAFFQPGKIGKNAAFNLAAKYAKGDWIYFMGADDVLPPDALKNWVKYIANKDPGNNIAVCGKIKVISNNKKYDGLVLPKNRKTFNGSGPYILMSRGMLDEVLPIPTNYPNEDNWWSLIIRYFSVEMIRINDIIAYYRIHEGNSISRNSNFSEFNEKYHSRRIVTEEFLDRYKKRLTEKEKNILYKEIKLENYRHKGEIIKIIFMFKCGFKNKIRALFFSKEVLYKIKIKFDRFMLGH